MEQAKETVVDKSMDGYRDMTSRINVNVEKNSDNSGIRNNINTEALTGLRGLACLHIMVNYWIHRQCL